MWSHKARLDMSFANPGIFFEKLDKWKVISLICLIVVSATLLFYNAFRFELPLGFSGMYTLMAEQISDNGYALPESTPYYGPGGIPFAYPPLGFYVMAVIVDLFDVSIFTYLRFMPPLFSLLALVPFFLLVERMTFSFWAAVFSTALLLFSPTLFQNHTWSAGMVRGLAFFLMLCGFYCFYRALEEGENRSFAILTGIFLGLTGLTHLFYGMFFALWVICFGLIEFNINAWKKTLLTLLTSALVGAPWAFVMITRYGFQVFTNAFSSHDNYAFQDTFLQGKMGALLSFAAVKITEAPLPVLGFVFSAAALIYLFAQRKFGIPVILFVMVFLLSPESERFLVLVIILLTGIGFSVGMEKLKSLWLRIALVVCVVLSFAQMAAYGLEEVLGSVLFLNKNAIDVADFVEANVPEDARYLFVAGQSEAEWFPYFLRREPFVSKWGSEWLGTYDQQRILQGKVSYCKDGQSYQCLKDLELNVAAGDILITKKNQKTLAYELETSGACQRLAVIGIYVLWSADCLAP